MDKLAVECRASSMTRRYARAAPGERAVEGVRRGHWERLPVLGSLRLDGPTAALALEGACDRESSVAYLEHGLLPTPHEGDVAVLDNLSVHKHPDVEALLAAWKEALAAVTAQDAQGWYHACG
jgi:hypothetical protein